MCQGGEISLKHVTLTEAIGECNNGGIIANGIEVVNNHYTSRLNVTLSPGLVGTTVTCSVDTPSDLIPIGNDTLSASTSENNLPIHVLV